LADNEAERSQTTEYYEMIYNLIKEILLIKIFCKKYF